MNAPLYTTEILRLAASLPLETSLAAPQGRGERRSAMCGSVIVTEVKLDSAGRVGELAQKVQACAFGQASASILQHFAQGRSRDELTSARAELATWLRGEDADGGMFAVLSPARAKTARHAAILLPFDALIAALEDAVK